jgi:hypothetical protein
VMRVPFAIVGASLLWVREDRMSINDLSRTLARRAIADVAIRVKPTRHGTECRIDHLWLSPPMDAQTLIVINKWGHGFPTTSGNLGLAPIVSRARADEVSVRPTQAFNGAVLAVKAFR